jgi:hypothetical protein
MSVLAELPPQNGLIDCSPRKCSSAIAYSVGGHNRRRFLTRMRPAPHHSRHAESEDATPPLHECMPVFGSEKAK